MLKSERDVKRFINEATYLTKLSDYSKYSLLSISSIHVRESVGDRMECSLSMLDDLTFALTVTPTFKSDLTDYYLSILLR